jgi:dTDP-4-amino-4,6-dideoxygalactose transaminase
MNSRLDSIQAAVLLAKLKAFPEELELRQKVAGRYDEALRGLVGVPKVPEGCFSSWAQYTVKTDPEKRDLIASLMKEDGIPTMVYYPRPLHLQPAYAGVSGRLGGCPVSERLSKEVLSLPMHPYLDEESQERVAASLKKALSASKG